MEICDRIKQFRNSLGIDQSEISKLLQIPMRTYGTYERGESKPGSDAILRFVEIGMNANWLLTGQGEMALKKSAVSSKNNERINIDLPDLLSLCHYAMCEHYGEQYHFQTAATQIEKTGKLANEVAEILSPTSGSKLTLTVEDLVNFIKLLIKVGRFPAEFAHES